MRTPHPRLLLAVGWLLALASATVGDAMDFFVATNGNDQWSGHLASPNANRTDGPRASLAGAQAASRSARATGGGASEAVTIHVRGGRYRLEAPLIIEPRDSGAAAAPVIFTAYQNERPVFSGGEVIAGFRQNGPRWEAVIPAVKAGEWYFHQLFVNGQRRQRARSPNEGYHRIARLVPGPPRSNAKPIATDRFHFQAGDLQPWERLADVNLVLMHSWENSIHPLKSVDVASNMVQFTAPLKEWWGIGYWETNQRYFVENALELLDRGI